jgi:formate/nitrite transporter FocA (FNT family)
MATDRTDPSPTSYREILRIEIQEGLSELNRSSVGLALSGLSAGLDIGFGPFLMVVLISTAGGTYSAATIHILTANAYAVGFIIVVLGRSELFTEHTTLAVIPVLHGEASVAELGRLWGIVYAANLIGATLFAGFVVLVGPSLGAVERSAFGALAEHLVASPSVTLAGGVLAGWLMGLLTWLVAAGRNSISQIVFVWLVALTIGMGYLPHSIAGTVEVLFAVFAGQGTTLADFGGFLLWSSVGNALGGSVFVGLLKYGHGIKGGKEPEAYDDEADVGER